MNSGIGTCMINKFYVVSISASVWTESKRCYQCLSPWPVVNPFKSNRQLSLEWDDRALFLSKFGCRCFSVAEVPWYQQKVASAIFATPPTSTYEEALKYFLRAERIEPNFYRWRFWTVLYCRMSSTCKKQICFLVCPFAVWTSLWSPKRT